MVTEIVAFHQHVPAPLADSDHKEIDLEIARRFPLAEDFEDSLLGILVFDRRTLRAFEPADHIFHLPAFLKRGEFLGRGECYHAARAEMRGWITAQEAGFSATNEL